MTHSAADQEPRADTAKTVELRHEKAGFRLLLREIPATTTDERVLEIHTYDLGQFNALTARAAQARLQFRFAHPGAPLTDAQVAALQEEICRQPF